MYWTLVVFIVAGGPSITIDGFSRLDDCRAMGELNVAYVQVNPNAKFRCDKTGIPPVRCKPDTRSYGRDAECIQ
jgi:hypothetical protein